MLLYINVVRDFYSLYIYHCYLIIFTCFYVDHVTCQSMEYLLKDWTRHCILYVKHVVYIFLKGCLKRYDLLVVILKLIGVNLCLLVCFYRKHLSIACKIHCLFFRYYFKMIFFSDFTYIVSTVYWFCYS